MINQESSLAWLHNTVVVIKQESSLTWLHNTVVVIKERKQSDLVT